MYAYECTCAVKILAAPVVARCCSCMYIVQKMVASFHIPELQILLGLLKLNKYGRKAELLQRAQAALSRGVSRQIQEEIRELYRCSSLYVLYLVVSYRLTCP